MESSILLPEKESNRRYWQQLLMTTRMFVRVVWVHVKERDGELGKDDLIAKLFHSLREVYLFLVPLSIHL